MKRDLGAGGYASGRVQGDMMGDDDSGSEGDDLASGSDDSGQLSMGEEDSGSGGGSFIGGDEAELSDLDEASSDNEF